MHSGMRPKMKFCELNFFKLLSRRQQPLVIFFPSGDPLNENTSFLLTSQRKWFVSSSSIVTFHILGRFAQESHAHVRGQCVCARQIKRVSVESLFAVFARVCVCVCAYGWVHRCSVDVRQELSSWLRVRRSAAGQACDCSSLVLHPCVNVHISSTRAVVIFLFESTFSVCTCRAGGVRTGVNVDVMWTLCWSLP